MDENKVSAFTILKLYILSLISTWHSIFKDYNFITYDNKKTATFHHIIIKSSSKGRSLVCWCPLHLFLKESAKLMSFKSRGRDEWNGYLSRTKGSHWPCHQTLLKRKNIYKGPSSGLPLFLLDSLLISCLKKFHALTLGSKTLHY